ncbi:hypothetical protein As57867_004242, partial [Aphanomyces stellatus]
SLWSKWMGWLVEHCLDPATIGGRTLSDVPLLQSTSIVRDVEAEVLSTLHLRPVDIVDMYPVTPLQSGLLSALVRDPAEYILQYVFDIAGDFTFAQLEACGRKLVQATPVLRTVVASTPHGFFQAITTDDWSDWTFVDYDDDVSWGRRDAQDVDAATEAFLAHDRQRGFTLASKSFLRATGIRLADGRLRVVWTIHHIIVDGWSMQLLFTALSDLCHGRAMPTFVPFKHHVEWLGSQAKDDDGASRVFWQSTLRGLEDKTAPLALPKPATVPSSKYESMTRSMTLPDLKRVCQSLAVTPSSLFRAAWAIVLQQYTRGDDVIFGSIVSGRDTGVDGVETMIGMLVNTVPLRMHVPTTGLASDLIVAIHTHSIDLMRHAHCSLLDINRWTNASSSTLLFDTMLNFENYGASTTTHSKATDDHPFSIDFVQTHQFVDSVVGVGVAPVHEDLFHVSFSYQTHHVDAALVGHMADRFLHVASQIASSSSSALVIAQLDKATGVELDVLKTASAGPAIPLPYALLHHAFEALAATTDCANRCAIEFENEGLSYADLDGKANTVARELAALGVASSGARVAVVMERCVDDAPRCIVSPRTTGLDAR